MSNSGYSCVQIKDWMAAAGLPALWIDAIGNVRGRTQVASHAAPLLLLGSHFDTVIHGGAFDGTLGIISAICAVKALLQQMRPHRRHPGTQSLQPRQAC